MSTAAAGAPLARGQLLLALALALLGGCSRPCDGGSGRGCNLLLVSIDTLRADHLSVYGYERPTSPRLERLAAEAVVFERFFHSGGGTLASHMSMLTSLHPMTHGVRGRSGGRAIQGGSLRLHDDRVTLAEQLSQAGYATAAFVDSGWMRGRFGFDQGFDLYDDRGGHFARILPEAVAWLERGQRPFFLFLHTYDVHSEQRKLPYDCPGDYAHRYVESRPDFDGCRRGLCASRLLGRVARGVAQGRSSLDDWLSPEELAYVRDLYDGCINYADDALGSFLLWLDNEDLFDETLVVVTSDHGEQFGEHGSVLHGRGYEETVRIPLVMKLPHSAFAGRRVDPLAAMVDLMPTLLEILELPVPPEAQGRSLLPAIEANRPVRDDLHIFSVLRTDRYKYFAEERRLFDLRADPAERHNLFAERPELARRLESRVAEGLAEDERRARRDLRSAGETEAPGLDEEERRQLEALGYAAP